MTQPSGRVAVVGIGDDGAAGLAPGALALVEQATLLVGGARHLAFFSRHPARRMVVRTDMAALARGIRRAMPTERVVVLASGDPLCFGIGAPLIERLGAACVEIHPHVGAVQLAFARVGVAWQDAAILSAHGRDLSPVVARALGARTAAILTDPTNTPAAIARALLKHGMEPCRAVVLERLGGPAERITDSRLDRLPGRAFDPLNILLLLRERATRRAAVGLADDEYEHRGGMITKSEVRAVALSKLALRSGAIVWDVGAGCGSLSIEAAALAPDGRVYAIERDERQVQLADHNVVRHLATNVQLVLGAAPAALRSLPAPDAVFVGGSGGHLDGVLRASLGRLRPGGRLVLNAVLLETIGEAQRLCERAGWATEVCQIAISRSEPTAGGTRLAALNPVFILTARRAADA